MQKAFQVGLEVVDHRVVRDHLELLDHPDDQEILDQLDHQVILQCRHARTHMQSNVGPGKGPQSATNVVLVVVLVVIRFPIL